MFAAMLLKNKVAIIYGAGGSVAGAIARSFASEGAKLFLTGRSQDSIRQLADDIIAGGGKAAFAVVDASDERAVNDHVRKVKQEAGSVDISFNLTGTPVVQNIPLTELPVTQFIDPISISMQTRFVTAIAAAKVMMEQGNGVILTLTATPGGIGYPYTGGFAPTCCAIESFSRNLAAELGVYGVRVVNIRSGGSPDSKVFKEAIENNPAEMAPILKSMENDTMLKRLPLLADITNVAKFLASDQAGMITGITVDVTGGTTSSLNYRVASRK